VAIERLYAELRRGAARGEPAPVPGAEPAADEPATLASGPTRIAS
jgi:hypothetical protein